MSSAIAASTSTVGIVAEAADMTAARMTNALDTGEFTYAELVNVGGFFGVHPNVFFQGATNG